MKLYKNTHFSNNFLVLKLFFISIFLGCDGTNSNDGSSYLSTPLECIINKNNLISKNFKIIGGEECNVSDSPVVKLNLFDDESNPSYCSATMITNNYALSAAHCFPDFILNGYINYRNKKISIKRFILHPDAQIESETLKNDIALIEISESINVVPSIINNSVLVKIGDEISIFGYGLSQVNNLGSIGTLREGKMKITSINDKYIQSKFDGSLQNVCYGDSGGPAFVNSNGNLLLVGVTSMGTRTDCSKGDESFFVNLQSQNYKSFILSEIPDIQFSE